MASVLSGLVLSETAGAWSIWSHAAHWLLGLILQTAFGCDQTFWMASIDGVDTEFEPAA